MDASPTDLTPGISTQKLQPSNLSALSGVIAQSISTTTRFDLPIDAKTAAIIAQRGSRLSVGAISLTEAGSAWTDDTIGGGSGGASLSSPISGIS